MNSLFLYQKQTSFPAGYVADFCPIEREIAACRIYSVHSSLYLSLVCIGKGEYLRRDRLCCSCGVLIPGEKTEYASLADEKGRDLHKLEHDTNPGVSERYGDLVELGRKIKRGGAVSQDLKRSLVSEQFSLLEEIAAKCWSGETKVDRYSLVFAALSLAAWLGAMVLVPARISQEKRLDAVGIIFASALVLLVINAVVFFLGPRRAINTRVLPCLAAGLEPLNPSLEELEAILADMRSAGYVYSTRVSPARITKEIQQVRSRGLRTLGR